MADKPLYAQFDGDEINGKFYALGDAIDSDVDAGTLAFLKTSGRIAFSKPAQSIVVPSSDVALEDMSREELEGTARSLVDLSSLTDDELREKIAYIRDEFSSRKKDEDEGKARADREAAYADLKDKPVNTLKTAELEIVAAVEEVDLSGLTNNVERAKAIQAARDAA